MSAIVLSLMENTILNRSLPFQVKTVQNVKKNPPFSACTMEFKSMMNNYHSASLFHTLNIHSSATDEQYGKTFFRSLDFVFHNANNL